MLACEYLPLCSRLEHLRREEAVVGIGYPDWCFRHCFRENIGLCCGVEQGSFNSIYHLVSGVWNTIVFLVQLGIANCCQWERSNPLTLVAELCALACQLGLDRVQRPKSGIQGRQGCFLPCQLPWRHPCLMSPIQLLLHNCLGIVSLSSCLGPPVCRSILRS